MIKRINSTAIRITGDGCAQYLAELIEKHEPFKYRPYDGLIRLFCGEYYPGTSNEFWFDHKDNLYDMLMYITFVEACVYDLPKDFVSKIDFDYEVSYLEI